MKFLKWELALKRRSKPLTIPEVIKGEVLGELKPFLTALVERLEAVEKMANATRVKVYRDASKGNGEPVIVEDLNPRQLLANLNPGDSVPDNLLNLL
ncbi:hypothetical protein ES703_71868 [subsurface metagenome]